MLIRSVAPKLNFNSQINKPEYSTLKLSNNIPLHYIEDKNQSICGIEIIFSGGKIYESTKGASFFSSNLLKSGIKGFDSNEISEFFELRGAFVQVQAGLDFNSLSLYCLSDKLEETLSFFLKLFNQPEFPEKQLAKLVKKKEQELDINDQKSNYWASKLLKKALFDNHPYGHVLNKSELKSITNENLIEHWKKYSLNRIKFITAVGNFNLDKLSNELEADLYTQIINTPQTRKNNNASHTSSFISKNMLNNEQSSLKIGVQSIGLNHSDYPGLSFGNTILGGYFGSRLMQSIREDKGLTYGINSTIIHLAQSSYIQISADIKMGAGEEVINLIKNELNKLTTSLIKEDEFNKVKSYLVGEYKSNTETIFDKMSKIKFLKINNLPNSYYVNHFNAILNLNSEQVHESLYKHFSSDSFNTVLIE